MNRIESSLATTHGSEGNKRKFLCFLEMILAATCGGSEKTQCWDEGSRK